MGSGYVPRRARIGQRVSVSLTLFLLVSPVGAWTDDVASDPTGPRSDDRITINKDYSSQRYVDLDQVTPKNVDKLKEICEIQLNEPVYFNSGPENRFMLVPASQCEIIDTWMVGGLRGTRRCASKVETPDGAFWVQEDEPAPRIGPGLRRTP